jgi:DNA-binding SARP family transcriptional activator
MQDGAHAVVVPGAAPGGSWVASPESVPGVLVCLLGHFRVLGAAAAVPLRHGGKMEHLLCALALREHQCATREALLEELWPGCDHDHASQSLNTLVHEMRRRFAAALAGRPPVVRTGDGYRLNAAAGVTVDVVRFDDLAATAAECFRSGDANSAIVHCEQAVGLYQGDLCAGDRELRLLVERERLRAAFLTMLGRLADHHVGAGSYAAALGYAQRLLRYDPCREDAHRVVMRCFARLGLRSQAMQQYKLCRQVLRREFDAAPEQATEDLFGQLRLHPEGV